MAEPMTGEIKGLREEAVFLELRAKKHSCEAKLNRLRHPVWRTPYYGDTKQFDFH